MSQELPRTATGARPMRKLPLDFEAFHRMYRPIYVHWAEIRLGSRADAEEAVDAAFEKLLRAWSTVLTKENPTAYAWRVLRHTTIDFSRARDRRPALIGEAAFETVALSQAVDPIGQFEESLSLYEAIGQLPPRQMDVMLLQFGQGFTVEEVAAALGITPAGVRSTVRHARRRLEHAYGVKRRLEATRNESAALREGEGESEGGCDGAALSESEEGHADDIAH
ncbi:sigma-70 family RNA polymerase sigma factor [Streptomyces umbrinus]|uniref:sigma-70 family RNA polymerase sigma factor n=1 Tax=Streptomyces umbrinus TaxID=67370 RepID=UPI00344AD6BD